MDKLIVLIPLEYHSSTYGPGWKSRQGNKISKGQFFGVPYIWKTIMFQRYCNVLVNLDFHQELGTEGYAFFRWQNGNLQLITRQQTGLPDEEAYEELGDMIATSLLEIN